MINFVFLTSPQGQTCMMPKAPGLVANLLAHLLTVRH